MPQVSFGMPVYNGEHYVAQAIESVLNQDLDDLELSISDNASTDETAAIVESYARHDGRIRYERQPRNRGGAWNFDRVFEMSSAPYFTWICADDWKAPDFASATLSAMSEAGPDVAVVYTRTHLVDADGVFLDSLNDDRLGLDHPEAHVRVGRLLHAQASPLFYGLIRSELLATTRGFSRSIAPDIVMLVELACRGSLVLVDRVGFFQRRHPAQMSAQNERQMEFYKPGGSARFAFQHNRVNLEIARGIRSGNLAWNEELRCYWAELANWVVPRWRASLSDLRPLLAQPRFRSTSRMTVGG